MLGQLDASSSLVRRDASTLSPATAYLLRQNTASQATLRYSLEAVVRMVHGLDKRAKVDAEAFPWAELRSDHVAAIRHALEASYAATTANRHLAALRGVLEILADQEIINSAELRRCRKAARSINASDAAPAGRMLSPDEVRAMMAAANCTRDRAILALATYQGLRREEISSLNVEDFDLATGRFEVVGKGRKRRESFLGAEAQTSVEAWLAERGQHAGPLLWRRTSAGNYIANRRLTKSGVWTAISTIARRASISVTPHDFRRTYASTMLDNGVDIATVQKLMGHSNPATTSRYDRRGDVAKRAAVAKLDEIFKG